MNAARLAQLYQRINRLSSRMGDPRYLPVSIVINGVTTELSPALKAIPLDGNKASAYLSANVQLQGDEWQISGIARTVPIADLQKASWIVDGWIADLVYLDISNPITVSAIVRKRDRGI